MKKPNLQRLAQRSKIYLRKASPTILSGLGAAGVIVTSVLAVRATPKALRKIRADSKANHKGDPEAYSKLEAVKSAYILDNMKKKLQALQYADQSAMQPGA